MKIPRYIQWIMTAKKESICDETGQPINIGDKILFRPKSKSKYSKSLVCNEHSDSYIESITNSELIKVTGHKN